MLEPLPRELRAEPSHRAAVRQIPTQYPFVLVDRVLEHDPGGRLLASKNVTGTEDFFVGHFPGSR